MWLREISWFDRTYNIVIVGFFFSTFLDRSLFGLLPDQQSNWGPSAAIIVLFYSDRDNGFMLSDVALQESPWSFSIPVQSFLYSPIIYGLHEREKKRTLIWHPMSKRNSQRQSQCNLLFSASTNELCLSNHSGGSHIHSHKIQSSLLIRIFTIRTRAFFH